MAQIPIPINSPAWDPTSARITPEWLDFFLKLLTTSPDIPWLAYAPVITGSTGTEPVPVFSSAEGKYMRVGRSIIVKVSLRGVTTASLNTGIFYLSLPVITSRFLTSSLLPQIGSVTKTSDITDLSVVYGKTAAQQLRMELWYNRLIWGQNGALTGLPLNYFTVGVGQINLSFCYEVD